MTAANCLVRQTLANFDLYAKHTLGMPSRLKRYEVMHPNLTDKLMRCTHVHVIHRQEGGRPTAARLDSARCTQGDLFY